MILTRDFVPRRAAGRDSQQCAAAGAAYATMVPVGAAESCFLMGSCSTGAGQAGEHWADEKASRQAAAGAG